MDSGLAHARYRELLYPHGHGYPFWIPEPSDALSAEQKAAGIRLGDLGVLTDDGGFDYLWNVHLPADHSLNKSRVPPDFEPLPPLSDANALDVRKIDNFHPEKTAITSASVKKHELKVDGTVEPALISGLVGGGVGFEFSTESDCGAILTLPRGAARVDALKRMQYKSYAAKHAESWYRYVNQDLQRGVQSGMLYLVTGTDKCSSWGVASFSRPSGTRTASLKFVASGAGSANVAFTSSWSADFGVEHRVGVRDASEMSQCVFARGFVISVRDSLWAKLCGVSVKTTSLYSKQGMPSFVGSGRPFSSSSRSVGYDEAQQRGDIDVQVEAFPPQHVYKSPAALLGERLLEENADACLALVHDEDWIVPVKRGEVQQNRDASSSFLDALVLHLASSRSSDVADGICTLSEADATVDEQILPPSGDENKLVGEAASEAESSSFLTSVEATTAVDQKAEVVELGLVSKPRLFALIIGINVYKHSGFGFSNLQGAVADADDMVEFLTSTIGVDTSSIRNLRNSEATREAIIEAFCALRLDERIQIGDPILIFYAGHGSQTAAPADWEAGGRGVPIQMILPHDFLAQTTANAQQQGIPDLTLAEMLSQLAAAKGNNITVIFDSCHSGSSTRDPLELGLLSRGVSLPTDYAILSTVDQDILRDKRKAKVAKGFEMAGSASHVLLAACSETESSYESNGRGQFTQALLAFLRDPSVRTNAVTCGSLIEQLPDLPRQHPQCEGKNRARILFNGKAPGRNCVLYSVKVINSLERGEIITLAAGQAHGISDGAVFDVFVTKDIHAQPVCSLVANTTSAFSADLSKLEASSEQTIPQPAWALQTKIGKRLDLTVAVSPGLREMLSPVVHELGEGPNKRTIRLVEPTEPHDLEVRREGDKAVFVLADKICADAGLTQLAHSVALADNAGMYAVLQAAADFFFHLRRSNKDAPLADKLMLEAFELQNRYEYKEREFVRKPKDEQNLVEGGMVQLEVDEETDKQYGFRLTSGSERDLYVWVFMFDMCDFSIEPIYEPTVAKRGADPSIRARGSLTLGYGAGGAQPQTFYLPDDLKVDVTYLKIFITSEPVDLSYLKQDSPFPEKEQVAPVFDQERKHKSVQRRPLPVWDTMLTAIVQKEHTRTESLSL